MPPRGPQRFGPYVLLRLLQDGGQGRVDLALMGAAGMERLCVIKRMLGDDQLGSDQRARFLHEMEIARRLSHGVLVKTLAVGEHGDEPYIVQELVEGHNLDFVLSACATHHLRMSVHLAVHIVREVARALAYVHGFDGLGLVHRDISPSNIEIAFNGEVKLLDFGIARSTVQGFVTRAGQFLGRPAYTPPEVWTGAGGDHRIDLYALGVVLWELLSRRSARTDGVLPAPSISNPDVPRELDVIVAKALAEEPDQRFQSATDLRSALDEFLPAGFDGEVALREFLARLFDVEAERKMLALDVDEAKRLLAAPVGGAVPEGAPVASRSAGVRRTAAFALVAIVFGSVGAALTARLRDRPAAACPPSVASAPPSPPAVVPPAPAPLAVEQRTASADAPTPSDTAPPGSAARRRSGLPSPRRTPEPADPQRVAALLAQTDRDLRDGAFDDAIRDARAAVEAGGGAPAHLLLGTAFMAADRLVEAEHTLATASRLEPDNPNVARRLAEVRQKLGGAR